MGLGGGKERGGGGSGDNACMYGEERARSTWALTNGPIGLYIIEVQLSLIGPSCLGSLRISLSSDITIVFRVDSRGQENVFIVLFCHNLDHGVCFSCFRTEHKDPV